MKKTLTMALASLLATTAFADGIKVITECKNLSSEVRTQISVTMTRTLDYRSRKSNVEINYNGSMKWDANPVSLSGTFTAALPVDAAAVPNLAESFQVKNGQALIAMATVNASSVADKMPLNERVTILKVPAKGQMVVLKIAMGRTEGLQQSAIGALYITDSSEAKVTRPDGGSSVSLVCSEEVHDI